MTPKHLFQTETKLKDLTPKGDVKAGSTVPGGSSFHPEDRPLTHRINGRFSNLGPYRIVITVIVSLACSAAVGFFNSTFVAGQYTQKLVELTDKVSRIEAIQQRMDDRGTNYSHYGLQLDEAFHRDTDLKLQKMESETSQIPVMKEKIERLEKKVNP